ncbi:MAG: VOC family protein [Candidatus Binatia bacterium]|nr:VOC family protein [Candidatus Binatia bacterium]
MTGDRALQLGRDNAVDRGLTHVALPVTNIDRSIDFYQDFAGMRVVHRRHDAATGVDVVWLSDHTRPFVLVLIQSATIDHVLGGAFCHLGVAVGTRREVDELCELARQRGHAVRGPFDSGPPVGYWVFIVDPDGHNLEISYGQVVGATLTRGLPNE